MEDNLLAVEHQVRQTALYSDDKNALDPKKHRAMNEEYLKMFVKMYGNQFDVSDLKAADMKVLEVLNNLYIEALGGKAENTEGDEKRKYNTRRISK